MSCNHPSCSQKEEQEWSYNHWKCTHHAMSLLLSCGSLSLVTTRNLSRSSACQMSRLSQSGSQMCMGQTCRCRCYNLCSLAATCSTRTTRRHKPMLISKVRELLCKEPSSLSWGLGIASYLHSERRDSEHKRLQYPSLEVARWRYFQSILTSLLLHLLSSGSQMCMGQACEGHPSILTSYDHWKCTRPSCSQKEEQEWSCSCPSCTHPS